LFQFLTIFGFSNCYRFSSGSLLLLNVEYLTRLATVCLIAGVMQRNCSSAGRSLLHASFKLSSSVGYVWAYVVYTASRRTTTKN